MQDDFSRAGTFGEEARAAPVSRHRGFASLLCNAALVLSATPLLEGGRFVRRQRGPNGGCAVKIAERGWHTRVSAAGEHALIGMEIICKCRIIFLTQLDAQACQQM